MSMSITAKAVWPLLWMECDDHGIFEWKPIVLKARLFPADTIDLSTILIEFESLGCVRKIDIDGKPCGLIRNFCRYQRPKKPSYRFEITPEIGTYIGLKPHNTEPVPNQLPTPTETPPQMKEEGGRMEKKEATGSAKRRTRYSPDFEERFWNPYPRTPLMSKKEAWAQWQRLSPEDRLLAAEAVPRFAAFLKSKPDHPIVHACRFLSQRRFDGLAEGAAEQKSGNVGYPISPGTDQFKAWWESATDGSFLRSQLVAAEDTGKPFYAKSEYPPGHARAA